MSEVRSKVEQGEGGWRCAGLSQIPSPPHILPQIDEAVRI